MSSELQVPYAAHMAWQRRLRRAGPALVLATLIAALFAGCASTGATFRSGVGDSFLEHPPYYAGVAREVVTSDTTRIGHLPIAFQPGASQPAIFDPRSGRNTPVDSLLDEMNGFLDSSAPPSDSSRDVVSLPWPTRQREHRPTSDSDAFRPSASRVATAPSVATAPWGEGIRQCSSRSVVRRRNGSPGMVG
jgi:hypothetical protein